MSLAQPNPDPGRPRSLKRILPQVGAGLLAVSCAAGILLAAVAKVQDAAGRTT